MALTNMASEQLDDTGIQSAWIPLCSSYQREEKFLSFVSSLLAYNVTLPSENV